MRSFRIRSWMALAALLVAGIGSPCAARDLNGSAVRACESALR